MRMETAADLSGRLGSGSSRSPHPGGPTHSVPFLVAGGEMPEPAVEDSGGIFGWVVGLEGGWEPGRVGESGAPHPLSRPDAEE